MAKNYSALIMEIDDKTGNVDNLVSGKFKNFKELELALERGLKASVIPRKKKAPAKKTAKKKAKK